MMPIKALPGVIMPRSVSPMSFTVPAGGMSIDRVPEMLDFYGRDIMLLIGGALLLARDRLAGETAAFVQAVKEYG